jgi:hypothetical protein
MSDNKIQKIFKPSTWLLAINAVMFILLFLKYIDYRYEFAVYRSMYSSNAVKENGKQTFINLVSLTFKIQTDRREQVKGLQGMSPFKSRWFRSGDMQLLDASGACGNFSHVLAELLQTGGYEVRIAQLFQSDHFGSHMVTEAKIDGKWVVADGLFKICFYNPDSSLASLSDIGNNYQYFEKQFPYQYPYKDAYLKYRYTNWDKIPIIFPALQQAFTLIMGEEWTNQLCLRSYFLNLHEAQFWILVLLYIPLLLKTIQHFYWFTKGLNWLDFIITK